MKVIFSFFLTLLISSSIFSQEVSEETLTPDRLCAEMAGHLKEMLENNFKAYIGIKISDSELQTVYASTHTFPGLISAQIEHPKMMYNYRKAKLTIAQQYLADGEISDVMMTYYKDVNTIAEACLGQFKFVKTPEEEVLVKTYAYETHYSSALPKAAGAGPFTKTEYIHLHVNLEKDTATGISSLIISMYIL